VPHGWLTADAARTVKEVVSNDGTIADAARELGVSRSAVKRALRRWGVRLARGTRRDVYLRDRLLDAVARGNDTCRDLGRALGVSKRRANELVAELVADGVLEFSGRARASRVVLSRSWTDAARQA
jgi:transposase-like protein